MVLPIFKRTFILIGLFWLIAALVMNANRFQNLLLFLSEDKIFSEASLLVIRAFQPTLFMLAFLFLGTGFFLTPLSRLLKKFLVFLFTLQEGRWLFLLIFFSLSTRLLWFFFIPTVPRYVDPMEYDRLGWSLATGGGYISNSGMPTAFWPVGYPFFLSLVYRLFGHSLVAAQWANILLSVFLCLLTYVLTTRAFDRRVGRLASLLLVFFPSQIAFSTLLITEVLFTTLFLMALFCLSKLRAPRLSVLPSLGTGFFLGLATLTRGLTILFPVVVLITLFKKQRFPYQVLIKNFILILLAMALVILPWSIRNFLVLKSPILLFTNAGVNFFIGNNEKSVGTYMDFEQGPLAKSQNEVDRHRLGYSLGLQFIQKHPLAFLLLGFKKIISLYGSDLDGVRLSIACLVSPMQPILSLLLLILSQFYYVIILFLVFLRLFQHPQRMRLNETAPLFLWTIGYWTLLHCFFFAEDRYHFPLIPLFVAFAAEAVILSVKD